MNADRQAPATPNETTPMRFFANAAYGGACVGYFNAWASGYSSTATYVSTALVVALFLVIAVWAWKKDQEATNIPLERRA